MFFDDFPKLDSKLIYQLDLDFSSIWYPTDLLSDQESDQNIKTPAKCIFVYQADFTRTDIGHLILSVSESDQQVRSLSNNKGAFSAIVSKSFYAQHRFTESLNK